MKVLAFDLETTGLLEEQDVFITEIGAVLFDTDTMRVIESFGAILKCPEGKTIPPHITRLTGVTDLACSKGMDRNDGFAKLQHMMNVQADAILTKNGVNFDIPFLLKERGDGCFNSDLVPVMDLQWDFEMPEKVRGRSQSHIAADLGFLNPFPHQALSDCLTLLEICRRIGAEDPSVWSRAYELAKSGLVEVEANVSFERKEFAKEAGFQWDKPKGKWLRTMRLAQVEASAPSWKFNIQCKNFPVASGA